MKDYYQIIGTESGASQREIKQAFRKLAVHYHPDKNPDPEAELKFKEINEAYEVLNNPVKRAAYDERRLNPYVESPPSPHRDPAYRRNSYQYQRTTSPHYSSRELMAEYLPKFRWMCWAGLVLTVLLAFDFFLPHQSAREDIEEITRVFRTGRYGGGIYDHDLIVTRQGTEIIIFNNDLLHFKDEPWVMIERTLIFSKVLNAKAGTEDYTVTGASIYSSLVFVPVILFVASLLGVTIRKKIEFPFNLSIVSGLFVIIVLYLIIR